MKLKEMGSPKLAVVGRSEIKSALLTEELLVGKKNWTLCQLGCGWEEILCGPNGISKSQVCYPVSGEGNMRLR